MSSPRKRLLPGHAYQNDDITMHDSVLGFLDYMTDSEKLEFKKKQFHR